MFWGVWRLEGERSVKSLRDSLEGGFEKKVGYYGMESVSDLERTYVVVVEYVYIVV